MNILNLKREDIEAMVKSGLMRPENLRHYDLCKAMAKGMTQEKAIEAFGYTDDRYIRRIKNKKCRECRPE